MSIKITSIRVVQTSVFLANTWSLNIIYAFSEYLNCHMQLQCIPDISVLRVGKLAQNDAREGRT